MILDYEQMYHLSRRLDPLADAEVDDDPGKQKTQHQVPFRGPNLGDAVRYGQYFVPEAMVFVM